MVSVGSRAPIGRIEGVDRSRWMGQLRHSIGSKTLREIVWPGSHDAGTGAFTPPYALVADRPDNQKLYKIWHYLDRSCLLHWAAGCLAHIVDELGQAQIKSIASQLAAGSRYFDLRLFRLSDGAVRLTHTIVGEPVDQVLSDVTEFLDTHPDELIILHERQREGFDLATYTAYINLLEKRLGDRLLPKSYDLSATYGEILKTEHRVIYLLPEPGEVDPPVQRVGFKGRPNLWSEERVETSWPNAQTTTKVDEFFLERFTQWNQEQQRFCIAQLVFSPTDEGYFLDGLRGRSLRRLTRPLDRALPKLLHDWAEKPKVRGGMNVLMFDFVNTNPAVVDEIILLNK